MPFTVVNMTRRAGASARTQALAKATEAVARRDAQRLAREMQLQTVLADFYHAQGEVERIHREADAAAAPFAASMREATHALEGLGESRAGIATLTGLTPAQVREYLVELPSAPTSAVSKTAKIVESAGRISPDRGKATEGTAATEAADPSC
jgi:hypothetical protein